MAHRQRKNLREPTYLRKILENCQIKLPSCLYLWATGPLLHDKMLSILRKARLKDKEMRILML